MEEKRIRIDELIAEHLSNGLDDDSLNELKEWIAASPENETHFMQMQEIWFSALDTTENRYNKEQAFENFKGRINSAKTEKDREKQKTVRTIAHLWQYVAVIAVVTVFSVFSYWRGGEKVKNAFAQITVEAPLGSKSRLYLPDGTAVWLNSGSRMSYSQGFGVEDRNVFLEGEGYFEVVQNKKIPFYVKTKDLQVKVVGTKFNFRNYPMDMEAVVSLEEGKVTLNNLLRRSSVITLAPDERVRLNKADGTMVLEKVVASNALQWTMGYLFFDEELLPDIVKKLERSYNVKIVIANDALKEFRFYGNFVRQEQSIQDILDVLSSTGKVHYKQEDKIITLY